MTTRPVPAAARSVRSLPAAGSARARAAPAHAPARAARRDPRRRRAGRVRRPLPPAVVAAGALGRRVPERRAEQPAAADPRRGAARAAPRSPRTRRRVERRRHGGRALGGGHAEGGALRARPAPREVLDVAPRALARQVEERRFDPADADRREDRGRRGAGRLPLRAPGRSSRASRSSRSTCATIRTRRSLRRSSATRARSRPRS